MSKVRASYPQHSQMATLTGQTLRGRSLTRSRGSSSTSRSRGRSRHRTNKRQKLRHSESYTRTKTKKKSELQMISQHNDMSVRDLGTVKVGAQHPIKCMGKFQYRNINQLIINGTQGKQRSEFLEVILPRGNFIAAGSNLRTAKTEIDVDLYTLNPFAVIPTSTLYPASPAVSKNDVLYLDKVTSTVELLSLTTIAQMCDVYWVTPVFDTNFTPLETWNQAIVARNSSQTAPTVPTSVATTTAVSGTMDPDVYGEKPFESFEMRRHWKMLKHVSCTLQPGDQISYAINFDIKTCMSRNVIENTRTTTYLKGISVIPFIVVRAGLIGVATSASGVDASEVAYGKARVGCLHNFEIKMGALPVGKAEFNRAYRGVVENTSQFAKQVTDIDAVQAIINA